MPGAERSVLVRVRGDIADYQAKMGAMVASTKAAMSGITAASRTNQAAAATVASASLKSGLAIAGVLALTGKAAIDWESAWTGVTKTVDGTDAQMASLQAGLRGMAKELPASATEIAGVAEAAGQLGVKVGDIQGFTRTMIDLGESTNLTAQDAATQIAQISNVTGLLGREGAKGVERFGSALVDLGNNSASTEADILAMASRIAGAGAIIGLSEADILGYAAALTSVGINAEAGGTAISRVFTDMAKAVAQGGDELKGFADVAGVSAAEFARSFEADPARAMQQFIAGLGRIRDAGGDVFTTLDNLGLADVRVSQALLKMAGAGDLLTESLDRSGSAWGQNTALQEEAAKRYATTASQLKIARNNVQDAAISIGQVFLPALASAAGGVSTFAGAIGGLPQPLLSIGTGAGVAAASILLIGGGALKASATVRDLAGAYKDLTAAMTASNIAGARAVGVLGAVGKYAGAASVALGAVAIAGTQMERVWLDVEGASDDATNSLIQYMAAGTDAPGVTRIMARGFEDLGGALDQVFDGNALKGALKFFSEVGTGFGIFGTTQTDDAIAFFQQLDTAMAGFVSRGGDVAQVAPVLRMITDEMQRQGIDTSRISEILPQYAAAMEATGGSAAGAAGQIADNRSEIQKHADAARGATTDIEDYIDALLSITNPALAAVKAEIDWRDALAAAGEAAGKNAKTLDLNSDAGRRNNDAMLAAAQAAFGMAEAMSATGAPVAAINAHLNASREALISQATQFGLSRAAAESYVDGLINWPAVVSTMVEAETESAQANLDQVQSGLDQVDGSTATATADVNSAPAQEELTSASANLARYGTQVGTATADANDQPAQASIAAARGTLAQWGTSWGTAIAAANNQPALASIGAAQGTLSQWGRSTGTSTAAANNRPAFSDLAAARAALSAWGNSSGTATARVNTSQALGAIAAVRAQLAALAGATAAARRDAAAARNPIYGSTGGFVSGDRIRKFGVGGLVTGPGSGTSDSILAWLSNGEAVTRARAVDYWGISMMRAINGADITGVKAALAAKGLAAGGVAGSPTAYTSNQYLTTQSVAAPSLTGLSIVGTLDTQFGPAQIRGVVRDEMRTAGRASARTVTQGGR